MSFNSKACKNPPKRRGWNAAACFPQWLKEWWEDHIEDLFNFHRLRAFRRFVKRLYDWAPILWNDNDWSPESLYRIMEYKISRIRREIEGAMRHYGDEVIIKEMKQAEFLLKRISNDDYYYDLLKVYPDGMCECPEEIMTFEDLPCGRGSRVNFHYCPHCEKNKSKWYKLMSRKERNDKIYVFDFIAKKSPRWWD